MAKPILMKRSAGAGGGGGEALDSRYLPGRRTDAWIKIKRSMKLAVRHHRFRGRRGSRFRNLIIAAEDDGVLRAVGTVGGGFDAGMRSRLNGLLWSRLCDRPVVACLKGKWIDPALYCTVGASSAPAAGSSAHQSSRRCMATETLEKPLTSWAISRGRAGLLHGRAGHPGPRRFREPGRKPWRRYSPTLGAGTALLVVGQRDWALGADGKLPEKLPAPGMMQRRQHASIEIVSEEQYVSALGHAPAPLPAPNSSCTACTR